MLRKGIPMKSIPSGTQHRGRRLILRLIGAAVLLTGLLAAFLGPVEMYCFYLFSEGGRFHYEGFGFGSFMFGNLAAQIMGYYLIAAVLIPLGYGTLTLQNWARHLTLAALRFWVVAGLPLILAFFFVLVSSKEPTLSVVIVAGILLAASYLLLPGMIIRFYNSPDTRLSFKTQGPNMTWVERIPIPVLALGYVFSFFIIILHAQIFFNGMLPLFGVWMSGLTGIILIDISILSLLFMLWGTLRTVRWAWWSVLAYFCLMTISYVVTLLSSSWQGILSIADFPIFEIEILQGIPLQGYHLSILVGIPFLLTIGLILRARPYFGPQDR
jgi:hypothetical protein